MARPRKKPTTFPHYILLRDAAKQYRLSADLLTRFVSDGKIPAVKVNGDFAVEEQKLKIIAQRLELEETLRKKYRFLKGHAITLPEAGKKYRLEIVSLWRWIKDGRVTVLNAGHGMKIDESDVAVIRGLADVGELHPGKNLFV